MHRYLFYHIVFSVTIKVSAQYSDASNREGLFCSHDSVKLFHMEIENLKSANTVGLPASFELCNNGIYTEKDQCCPSGLHTCVLK